MHWMQELKKNPVSFDYTLEKLFYYREGSTIFHDFALDPERLA